jgi:ATP-binding cassette subfamily B protein
MRRRRALAELAWPMERMGEGLQALVRVAGLEPLSGAASAAADGGRGGPGSAGERIEATAAALGVSAEGIDVLHGETAALLRRAAPAIVAPLARPGAPCRFFLLAGSGARRVLLVGPDGRLRRTGRAAFARALTAPFEASARPEVERLLAEAGVPRRRRRRAAAAMLGRQLVQCRVAGAWLVGLPAGGSLWRQCRRARLPRRLAAVAGAHLAQQAQLVLAWWLVGRGVLAGGLDPSTMWAVSLLLVGIPLLRAAEVAEAAGLTCRFGALLRRRLLAGALRFDGEELRSEGSGRLLGRVLAAEAFESSALTGGLAGLIAASELALAAPLLAVASGGWLLPLMLIGWCAGAAILLRRLLAGRRAWTEARLAMTHELVEQLEGHRTRVVQQSPGHWHTREDLGLSGYLRLSRAVDGRWAVMRVGVARGWLVVALASLAPSLLAGAAAPPALAATVGSILLAWRALERLAGSLPDLTEAAVAWRALAPLLCAAGNGHGGCRQAVSGEAGESGELGGWADQETGGVDLGGPWPVAAAGGSGRAAGRGAQRGRGSRGDGECLVEARELGFAHRGMARPVLAGCSFAIQRGERVLLEGASGEGKSTLAALLGGLRAPSSGLLLVGGYDAGSLARGAWRRLAVCAPQFQDNCVFSDSLAFNLLLGRGWPPEAADLEEAEAVCRELGLGELVRRMPAGLWQRVGDGGWQLSHGEKSRVYMARALLQGAELVVLDESFAALDPETLECALACAQARARTLVVVAHP